MRILVITAARGAFSLSSNNRIRIAPKPQEAGKIASLHLRREPTYPAASTVVQNIPQLNEVFVESRLEGGNAVMYLSVRAMPSPSLPGLSVPDPAFKRFAKHIC